MAKKGKDHSKARALSYQGCYGPKLTPIEVKGFLNSFLKRNIKLEKKNKPKQVSVVWGHPGIGKTDSIKAFRDEGYEVVHLPLAQMEEMGDILGYPGVFLKIKKEMALIRKEDTPELSGAKTKSKTKKENSERLVCKDSLSQYIEDGWKFIKDEMSFKWVLKDLLEKYTEDGWKLEVNAVPKTGYAPPDWIPKSEKSILLIDDFNRASSRIIKGCMQLIQDYGTISWNLPKGCSIIMTGNPEGQDYLVSAIDDAILTRCVHLTMLVDKDSWVIWAEKNDIDSRGINWVITYSEQMVGNERTNPRTLTQFFEVLPEYKEIARKSDKGDPKLVKELQNEGLARLDSETVASFLVFATKGLDRVPEPLDVLNNLSKYKKQIKDWINAKEPRVDIINIIYERIFAFIVQEDYKPTKNHIKSFQELIMMKDMPDDVRFNIARRIANHGMDEKKELLAMLTNKDELGELLAETVR